MPAEGTHGVRQECGCSAPGAASDAPPKEVALSPAGWPGRERRAAPPRCRPAPRRRRPRAPGHRRRPAPDQGRDRGRGGALMTVSAATSLAAEPASVPASVSGSPALDQTTDPSSTRSTIAPVRSATPSSRSSCTSRKRPGGPSSMPSTGPASSTVTSWPRRAASPATDRPTLPPPSTTTAPWTSGRSEARGSANQTSRSPTVRTSGRSAPGTSGRTHRAPDATTTSSAPSPVTTCGVTSSPRCTSIGAPATWCSCQPRKRSSTSSVWPAATRAPPSRGRPRPAATWWPRPGRQPRAAAMPGRPAARPPARAVGAALRAEHLVVGPGRAGVGHAGHGLVQEDVADAAVLVDARTDVVDAGPRRAGRQVGVGQQLAAHGHEVDVARGQGGVGHLGFDAADGDRPGRRPWPGPGGRTPAAAPAGRGCGPR